ncbi:hypothetical protein V7S43_002021 [Phytophthora oleae]|uniref:Hexosyltransferase n=1 Tax=Phytophthora oleae TaxID=2107226 RepID=A0ABD3G182_9STRA
MRAILVFLAALAVSSVVIGYEDPITMFQIEYPPDNSSVTLPLRFRFSIEATRVEDFKERFGSAVICLELLGLSIECSPILVPKIRFQDLPLGDYVARAYIYDGDVRYHETKPLSFSLVSAAEFEKQLERQIEETRENHKFPPDLNILEWAMQSNESRSAGKLTADHDILSRDSSSTEVLLTIGVKTAVVDNFARRQAIRDTWASKVTLPANVRVFFIGCMPNMAKIPSKRNRQRLRNAIALERAVYGDLLTEELECEDSHFLLANKVSAFIEWVVAELPETKFVMIADDDIYMRVRSIARDLSTTVPQKRLYLGELSNGLHPSPLAPTRIPDDPYFTSERSYPLSQFVPYAAGPHFLLSIDCVQFIAQNRRRLASISGQDDTSIALWLLAIQVHVEETPALASLRFSQCKNNVLSFADLSPLGIRFIHANLLHNRTFCHGFELQIWEWRPLTTPSLAFGDQKTLHFYSTHSKVITVS